MDRLVDDCSNSVALRRSKVDVLAFPQQVSSDTGVAAGTTGCCEDKMRTVVAFSHPPSEKCMLKSFFLPDYNTHLNLIHGTSMVMLPSAWVTLSICSSRSIVSISPSHPDSNWDLWDAGSAFDQLHYTGGPVLESIFWCLIFPPSMCILARLTIIHIMYLYEV